MQDFDVITIIFEIVIGAVALGAIPWGMKVTRELGVISTKLSEREWQDKAIGDLRSEINSIKVAIASGRTEK